MNAEANAINNSVAMTTEDIDITMKVFRPVRCFFRMYGVVYVFLILLIALFIYVGISVHQHNPEMEISSWLGFLLPFILLLFILRRVHPFARLYFNSYRALKKDLANKRKMVVHGVTTDFGLLTNCLIYQLNEQDYPITNILSLKGWRMTSFNLILNQQTELHYLPESLFLLKVHYKEIPTTTSELKPLTEQQIAAYKAISNKNVPTMQRIYSGTVTEICTADFHISLRAGTSSNIMGRLGDREFLGLSNKLEVGAVNTIKILE